MKRLHFLPVLVALLLPALQAQAKCDFDDFPVMDDMSVRSIMDDANYNNRPMMVRSFSASASIDQVVDYYHKLWAKRYDDSVFGIWDQISTMTDDCLMTVQVAEESADSSFGRLIISNPPTVVAEADVGAGLVAPADAVVVSDLKTNDGNKVGRLSVLTLGESVREAAGFYMAEMQRNGWSLERNFSEQGGLVLMFRQGLKTSNVLLVPAGESTQVLINEVEIR